METLWILLIGGVIGAFAGYLTSRDLPMGWIGNIIAGMALVPSILGAVALVIIASFIFTGMNRSR